MDIEHVRVVLKDQLKLKGLTYEDIASPLKVSVPTVKRWLTKTEIPFYAIDKILEVMEINWSELIDMVESPAAQRKKINKPQEDFLTKDSKAAYLFLLLFQGFNHQYIKNFLGLSDNDLEKYYFKMDKIGLINYISLKRIRILTRGPFKFKPRGSFAKKYLSSAAQIILDKLLVSYFKYPTVPNYEPRKDLLKFGEIFLSEKSFERLKLELDEVLEKYQEISRRESLSKGSTGFAPRVYLVGSGNFNLWKTLMWDN